MTTTDEILLGAIILALMYWLVQLSRDVHELRASLTALQAEIATLKD
jgi:hypothetical protein